MTGDGVSQHVVLQYVCSAADPMRSVEICLVRRSNMIKMVDCGPQLQLHFEQLVIGFALVNSTIAHGHFQWELDAAASVAGCMQPENSI